MSSDKYYPLKKKKKVSGNWDTAENRQKNLQILRSKLVGILNALFAFTCALYSMVNMYKTGASGKSEGRK